MTDRLFPDPHVPPQRPVEVEPVAGGRLPLDADGTWSVVELVGAVAEHLRSGFPQEVWVRGEIADLSRKGAGSRWFVLRDAGTIRGAPGTGTISVVVTPRNKENVNRLLRRAGGAVEMTEGTEVRIRGVLDVYEPRGQLQLRMTSIDTQFTLGRLAEQRADLLARLRAEGVLRANAGIPMPALPLRVGLVTSRGSAAEADVVDQLARSGFDFRITIADVRVQGPQAPIEVAQAIAGFSRDRIDVIVVARGGGATTDLAAFDEEVVARAIAGATRPVLVGVGHETDRSVADEVAHTAAKTPTAAAEHLVSLVTQALDRVESAWGAIQLRAEHSLTRAEDRLDAAQRRVATAAATATGRAAARVDEAGRRLARAADTRLAAADLALDATADRLLAAPGHRLGRAEDQLAVLAARVAGVDPARALARGWSLTRTDEGALVRSVADAPPGTRLRTRVADGDVVSVVPDDEEGGR